MLAIPEIPQYLLAMPLFICHMSYVHCHMSYSPKKPNSSDSPYGKRQCSITTHFMLQWDPFPIMMRPLNNLVVFYAMFIFGFLDTYSNKTKIIFPCPKNDIDVFIWSLRGLYWFPRICCRCKYALVTCLRPKKRFTCSANIIPNPM